MRPQLLKFGIGAAHHFNWKKIGLSEAYFKSERVCEDAMPTMKAKAAFIFIRDNNGFYRNFLTLQHQVLDTQGSKNMSSYDLFIVHHGIECAMFPHLYPLSQFTDTGILQQYMEETHDHTNRVVSIGPLPFLHAVGEYFEKVFLVTIMTSFRSVCLSLSHVGIIREYAR